MFYHSDEHIFFCKMYNFEHKEHVLPFMPPSPNFFHIDLCVQTYWFVSSDIGSETKSQKDRRLTLERINL